MALCLIKHKNNVAYTLLYFKLHLNLLNTSSNYGFSKGILLTYWSIINSMERSRPSEADSHSRNRGSSVTIVTSLRAGRSGLDSRQGQWWDSFSSPPRPDRFWGPPSLLSNGHREIFPWGQSGRGVMLTTHLHLVPEIKNAWGYTSSPPYVFMAWY
jgi:hypothetical protein